MQGYREETREVWCRREVILMGWNTAPQQRRPLELPCCKEIVEGSSVQDSAVSLDRGGLRAWRFCCTFYPWTGLPEGQG